MPVARFEGICCGDGVDCGGICEGGEEVDEVELDEAGLAEVPGVCAGV